MDFSALNTLDYIVLSVVLISVLFGFAKGFIQSILSLVGWVLAGYIAYAGFPLVKPVLLNHFSNEMAVNVGGPVALYFTALIVISLVSYQITSLLGGVCGGMIDRSLGMMFGFMRGALIVTVAFIGLTMVAPGMESEQMKPTYHEQAAQSEKVAPEWVQKAQTYPLLRMGQAMLASMLSNDMLNTMQQMVGVNKKGEDTGVTMLQAAKVVERIQDLLPKDVQLDSMDIDALDKMSPEKADKRRKELYHIILEAYKTAVKSGKIPSGVGITEQEMKQLETAIAAPPAAQSSGNNANRQQDNTILGYDKKQLNELNRLIQTVQ